MKKSRRACSGLQRSRRDHKLELRSIPSVLRVLNQSKKHVVWRRGSYEGTARGSIDIRGDILSLDRKLSHQDRNIFASSRFPAICVLCCVYRTEQNSCHQPRRCGRSVCTAITTLKPFRPTPLHKRTKRERDNMVKSIPIS